jgi:hypothetical protein
MMAGAAQKRMTATIDVSVMMQVKTVWTSM